MFQKLQLNFSVLFILVVLLVSGGQSFAQTPDNNSDVNNKDVPAEERPEENHDTKDLEQLLKRYNTDAEKVLNDANKLHKEEAGQEVSVSDMEDMRSAANPMEVASKNALKKAADALEKKRQESLKNHSDYSGAVRLALMPLQKLSEKELLKQIEENSKNSPIRPYLDKFPNVSLFAVKLVKDTESLPSIAKIVEDRDKLIYFGGIMVATIIFGFFLKKLMHREGRSFIKSLIYFILRMHIMFALRIYIIYYFYSAELTPAARIFSEIFI